MDIPVNAKVEATDGHVGTVQDVLKDATGEQAGRFVLHVDRLFGDKEITLPLSVVDRVEGNVVYVKLDKKEIHQLPYLPAKRHAGDRGSTQVELIARIFDHPDRASQQLKSLDEWNRLHSLKLHNAAVLVKDKDGQTSIKETKDPGLGKGGLRGALAGALVGVLAGPGGVIIGALAGAGAGGAFAALTDMGFPDEFLQKFEEHLKPGTSALVLLIERDSRQSLSQAMAGMDGVVLQETLTDKMVEELLAGDEAEA